MECKQCGNKILCPIGQPCSELCKFCGYPIGY